jgi:hypothetical protein
VTLCITEVRCLTPKGAPRNILCFPLWVNAVMGWLAGCTGSWLYDLCRSSSVVSFEPTTNSKTLCIMGIGNLSSSLLELMPRGSRQVLYFLARPVWSFCSMQSSGLFHSVPGHGDSNCRSVTQSATCNNQEQVPRQEVFQICTRGYAMKIL